MLVQMLVSLNLGFNVWVSRPLGGAKAASSARRTQLNLIRVYYIHFEVVFSWIKQEIS